MGFEVFDELCPVSACGFDCGGLLPLPFLAEAVDECAVLAADTTPTHTRCARHHDAASGSVQVQKTPYCGWSVLIGFSVPSLNPIAPQ
jgi:hypothetical protein